MAKIVELVQTKDYETLKNLLETKIAKKIKDVIDLKKKNFVERMKAEKSKKKECSLTEGELVFADKLYGKLKETFKSVDGGMIKLGKYRVLVDVTGTEVEVHIMKDGAQTRSLAYESTPITKGVAHAAAFVTELVNAVITPDYKKDKEKSEKKGK